MALGIAGTINIAGNKSNMYVPGQKKKLTSLIYGFGITLDIHIKNDLGQYRITCGYDRLNNYNLDFDFFNRISLIHSFGFSIIDNNTFQFYMGPQLGLRYQFCSTDYILADELISKNHYEIKLFGLGIGAIFGIDIKLSEKIIIAPEVGLRYEFTTGNYKNTWTTILILEYPYKEFYHKHAKAHGIEGGLAIGVIYRIE